MDKVKPMHIISRLKIFILIFSLFSPLAIFGVASVHSPVFIERYKHERDYYDLYDLFHANTENLGGWGYGDAFPGTNQIKVARVGNLLAGFVIYDKNDNEGFINYLAIDKSVRSFGLGSVLLRDAIKDLKNQGADKVSLNVYEHNVRAQSLYERLGFYLQSARDGLMNYMLSVA
jgi:ribosomal protein S18 acetylase RimI-like enzyme